MNHSPLTIRNMLTKNKNKIFAANVEELVMTQMVLSAICAMERGDDNVSMAVPILHLEHGETLCPNGCSDRAAS